MLGCKNQDSSHQGNPSNLINELSLYLVLFGILIRLIQYLSNRSLWGDESALALNIVNRSYGELLSPLDYNQAAPPGFLWIEKFSLQFFGNSEYSLRLFPLASSIVSLLAFYRLANRYSSAIAAPIAIALFACLRYIVYYATEVKQYSSDVMVALLLCLLLLPIRNQILTTKQMLSLGLFGAIAIWFSHPAVFVLAGIELGYLLIAPAKTRKSIILNRLPTYTTWLVSFCLLYVLTISGTMENESLQSSFSARYPDSPFDILWLLDSFGRFFYRPLGFLGITDGIAIFAFIVGCVAYSRKNPVVLVALISPSIATLIASYLHKYPFRERLVLFLAPFAILIIAEGIAFLLTQFRWRNRYITLVGVLVLFALLLPPAIQTSQLAIHPDKVAEIRPILNYVKSHQEPGDSLYVYPSSRTSFMYYAPNYGYLEGDYILGVHEITLKGGRKISEENLNHFKDEINQLSGKSRIWFVVSQTSDSEEKALLSYLNSIGQPVDFFRQPGAFVYLYKLR